MDVLTVLAPYLSCRSMQLLRPYMDAHDHQQHGCDCIDDEYTRYYVDCARRWYDALTYSAVHLAARSYERGMCFVRKRSGALHLLPVARIANHVAYVTRGPMDALRAKLGGDAVQAASDLELLRLVLSVELRDHHHIISVEYE